jgi:hypothetical protein
MQIGVKRSLYVVELLIQRARLADQEQVEKDRSICVVAVSERIRRSYQHKGRRPSICFNGDMPIVQGTITQLSAVHSAPVNLCSRSMRCVCKLVQESRPGGENLDVSKSHARSCPVQISPGGRVGSNKGSRSASCPGTVRQWSDFGQRRREGEERKLVLWYVSERLPGQVIGGWVVVSRLMCGA